MASVKEQVDFSDVQHITAQEYFTGEEFAADMFNAKYTQQVYNAEGSGVVRKETPAEVFWRVCYGLACMEETLELRDKYAKLWFSLMWNGWFRPGGSVISGVGASGKQSLLNCSTLPLDGDSLEDIARCDYTIMKCAAFRQGLGIDGSKLRPRGAFVNNAAMESTGVVPWVSKLVDNGKYVGQKGRMPALLISLKVHHPDIIEFITAKMKLGAIENANISVQITDAFMQAVKDDSEWELYFDFEDNKYPRISKNIPAKELFALICDTAYTSAEPGVQFIDALRKGSMVHQLFKDTGDRRFELISTNACSEKILPPYGVCNLLSPNMEMFSTEPTQYKEELEYIVPLLVRLSDNVVTYELQNKLSPLPEQAWILENTREIGLGITNVHGWFVKQNIAYASPESCDAIEEFFKVYATTAFKASMALGVEKGNAPAWGMFNNYSTLMGSSFFSNVVNVLFNGDFTKVTGLRNMALMSVAPTGSLSNTFPNGVLSFGTESSTGSYHWRKTRAINKGTYTHYFVIPNKIKEYLLSVITDAADANKVQAFPGSVLDEDGVIGKELVTIINKYVPANMFSPAHLIDPMDKVEMMSRMYKWVDAAISVTYNLPSTSTKEDVANIYMGAFDKGVRAVSVYVEGSREGILIFDDPVTNAKKFKEKNESGHVCSSSNRPTKIELNCAPKRPVEMPCDIHSTSIKGVQWTVLVGMLDGDPFEIFCGQNEDLYLPQSCKTGIIRKQGQGKYELEVMIRKSPVVFKDLAEVLMTDNERALTRLLSLSLRHGVPPQYIVQQLKKTNGSIVSFSTAISRVLSKYVSTYTLKDTEKVCPLCSEASLVYEEGCLKCATPGCQYSRCGG